MRKTEDLKNKLDVHFNCQYPIALSASTMYEYDILKEIYNYLVRYRADNNTDQMRIGVENALKWMVNGN